VEGSVLTAVISLLKRLRPLVNRLASRVRDVVFPASQGPSSANWQRIVLNQEVENFLATLPVGEMDAAEVSGKNHEGRGWKSFAELNYPGFDLCAPLEIEERFDIVFCEQVLEHVEDPVAAARNLFEMCRPGGYVVVSSPFLVKIHELPDWKMYDYWRFSPRGMRLLLEKNGLEVETVGQWGNRECIVGNFDRWTAFRRWHPTRNEPDLPVQVWAFARRPAADPATAETP
jgi:SAM-dependent methyltransferase